MARNTDRIKSSFHGPVLVVEIGNEWLKIAQVEPARNGAAITRLHLERFEGLEEGLSKALASAIKKGKFITAPAISYIPRQMANIRMISLPSTDPDEISGMVDLQIGKQTPHSKSEIVADYRVVGFGREGYSRIMLAIVQQSVARQRFHVFEEAGIEVQRMSISSEGLLSWVLHAGGMEGGEPVVLLDIDSSYSDFAIVSAEGILFTRSILIGADQLIDGGEEAKANLAKEIRHSLEISGGELPEVKPAEVWLSGAGVRVKGLDEYLHRETGLPVQSRDCLEALRKVPKSPFLSDPEYGSVSWTPMVGVALDPAGLQFDLTPDSVNLRKGLVTRTKNLTRLAILLMAVLIGFAAYGLMQFYLKKGYRRSLQAQLDELRPRVEKITEQQKIIETINHRRDPGRTAFHLMAAIHEQIPEGMLLETLDIQAEEKTVLLSGTSPSRDEIRTLIKNLKQVVVFFDVKDIGTSRDSRTGRYKFQVLCSMGKEG